MDALMNAAMAALMEIINQAAVFYDVDPRLFILPVATLMVVLLVALLIIMRHAAHNKAAHEAQMRKPTRLQSAASLIPAPDAAPDDGAPCVTLTVLDGHLINRVYRIILTESITIGRDPSCCNPAIHSDNEIAPLHCELHRDDNNNVIIKNLDSKKRTLVNGVPITSAAVLEDADVLILGATRLRVSIIKGDGCY
jgi:hypothetical protein